MVYRKAILTLLTISLVACRTNSIPTVPQMPLEPLVLVNASGALSAGFAILVNTDRQQTDWLAPSSDGLTATYPSGQQFGFVACVLAGQNTLGARPSRDLSGYRSMRVELRGATGGEGVEVGIKDSTDPDDGTETKITLTLGATWQEYEFGLSSFSTADLRRLYLLFELVFTGEPGRSVLFRNVRYLP